MRAQLSQIERAELYLLGLLNAEEKATYEVLLGTNSMLADQISAQQSVNDTIVRAGLKSSAISAWKIYRRRIWIARLLFGFAIACGISIGLAILNNSTLSSGNEESEQGQTELTFEVGTNSLAENNSEPQTIELEVPTIVETNGDDSDGNKVANSGPGNLDLLNNNSINVNKSTVENNPEVNQSEGALFKPDFSIQNTAIEPGGRIIDLDSTSNCEWIIMATTTPDDLELISYQISAEGGKLLIDRQIYKRKKLTEIKFVVSTRTGKVNYATDAIGESTEICIRINGSAISAGNCDSQSEINELDTLQLNLQNLNGQMPTLEYFDTTKVNVDGIDWEHKKNTSGEFGGFDKNQEDKTDWEKNEKKFKYKKPKRKSFFKSKSKKP